MPKELGQFRGHWDGRKLTLHPIDSSSATVDASAKSFTELDYNKVEFTTDEALVDNPGCPADPAHNYFNSGAHALSNGSICPDDHLCALVTLQNLSTRDLDTVFVEITQLTLPGFFGDGNPIATIPTGYPLTNHLGLWSYGTLPANGGGAQVEWHFFLPTCQDFDFTVKITGTLRRTSYLTSGANVPQSEFINACTLPGVTTILQNAGPGSVVSNIPLPFPFTLYDLTFDTDNLPIMSISSNGALGFSPITTNNVSLPDGSHNSDYTIFPFWDELQLGSSGVCYGVSGVAPNRKFVVTWMNADISSTVSGTAENLTFSAILTESSDLIQYIYSHWDNSYTSCTASLVANRGGSATIGAQGVDIATQFSFNNASLPARGPTCPGSAFKVTLTPRPGNAL